MEILEALLIVFMVLGTAWQVGGFLVCLAWIARGHSATIGYLPGAAALVALFTWLVVF